MDQAEIEARIVELLKLPYEKVVWGSAEDGYAAVVTELPGCMTDGVTAQEALERLDEAMAAWIETQLARGEAIPEAKDRGLVEYSGRFNLRLPKSLHRQLAECAEQEGVSLNQLTMMLVAQGLAGATSGALRPMPRSAERAPLPNGSAPEQDETLVPGTEGVDRALARAE